MASLTEALRACSREIVKDICTSIPGHVLSFSATRQLAQVQIGIEKVTKDGQTITPPPIILVPVMFPGGKFAIEYEISKGDEGVMLFSQRCIESWIDQGGVAPQKYKRFHDVNDAVFIPGIRSQKNKLADFQNNGVRLRNEDGSNYIWLKNDGTAEITITTLTVNGQTVINGQTTINGQTAINGDQTLDGDIAHTGNLSGTTTITASAANIPSIVSNGVNLTTHTHTQTNGGTTGAPKN